MFFPKITLQIRDLANKIMLIYPNEIVVTFIKSRLRFENPFFVLERVKLNPGSIVHDLENSFSIDDLD